MGDANTNLDFAVFLSHKISSLTSSKQLKATIDVANAMLFFYNEVSHDKKSLPLN